jgi:hypothetical protein
VIHQRASSSEDSEEEEHSIDHIEERIKRLEMDLEKKIDKHKKESSAGKDRERERPSTAVEKARNLKSNASPPLPKKMEAKLAPMAKPHSEGKPSRPK